MCFSFSVLLFLSLTSSKTLDLTVLRFGKLAIAFGGYNHTCSLQQQMFSRILQLQMSGQDDKREE